jgi:hypothetical protein
MLIDRHLQVCVQKHGGTAKGGHVGQYWFPQGGGFPGSHPVRDSMKTITIARKRVLSLMQPIVHRTLCRVRYLCHPRTFLVSALSSSVTIKV